MYLKSGKKEGLFACLVIVVCLGQGRGLWAEERPLLSVLASGALEEALRELNPLYERENNCEIMLTAFNSERVKRAILYGLTATDVFAIRTLEYPMELEKAGRINPDYAVLCFSRWVIVTAPGNPAGIKGLQDLGQTGVKIAVASKVKGKAKPYVYELPLELVEGAGVKEGYLQNVVKDFDFERLVPEAVSRGEADGAIVEEYLARLPGIKGKLEVIRIPLRDLLKSDLYRRYCVFTVGTVKESEQGDLARKYVQFLLSKPAQQILKKYGFVPVSQIEDVEFRAFASDYVIERLTERLAAAEAAHAETESKMQAIYESLAAYPRVQIGGQSRIRFFTWDELDFNAAKATPKKDAASFVVNRTWLRIRAKLASEVSVFFQPEAEWAWGTRRPPMVVAPPGAGPPAWEEPRGLSPDRTETSFDVCYANFTLNHLFHSPCDLTVGRQKIEYGDRLVMSDDSNGADAVKLTVNLKRARIDLFKIWGYERQFWFALRGVRSDADAFGLFVTAPWRQGELLAYHMLQVDRTREENTRAKRFTGIRATGTVPEHRLRWKAEAVLQRGRYDDRTAANADRRYRAHALLLGLAYTLPDPRKTTLTFQYALGTGDNPATNDLEEFRSEYIRKVYPTKDWPDRFTHLKWGFGEIAGWALRSRPVELQDQPIVYDTRQLANLRLLQLGVLTQPRTGLKCGLNFFHYRLNQAGGRSRHLGREIDLVLAYRYSPNLSFKLVLGKLFPGGYFKGQGDHNSATCLYTQFKMDF